MTSETPGTDSKVKNVSYTPIFAANRDTRTTTIVNVGGAGSSKSYSIAQLLLYYAVTQENKNIAVVRKTFPALRMTAMKLIIDLAKEYGLYADARHNKTANTLTIGTTTFWFFSIDESDKIKSSNFSYIWVEEANEITWEDYVILKTRLRQPVQEGEKNQIILSLNPSDAMGWIPKNLCGVNISADDNDKPS